MFEKTFPISTSIQYSKQTADSNLGRGYFAPRSTQPNHPSWVS